MRKPSFPCNAIFHERWSPRAFSGQPIGDKEIFTIFEAARWAPSSYNEQPWTFVYAMRDTMEFAGFFDLLSDFNKTWEKNVAALIIIVSKKNFTANNTPNKHHSFDAGAAWVSMALQASNMGLAAHAIASFDVEKATQLINLPDSYEIEAMVAVGRLGQKRLLPPDLLQREEPSDRKSLSQILKIGKFQ